MLVPPTPERESERLAELVACGILDTPPDPALDRLTRLAKELFGVKYCLISLVDRERQWFKSNQGLPATETPREVSFCGHAILDSAALVVEDARLDARFADNPLVTGFPNIRFYAGAPIEITPGLRIGTLCVIDDQPHRLAEEKLACLRDLGGLVADEFRRQRARRALGELGPYTDSLAKNRRLLQLIADGQLAALGSDSPQAALATLLENLVALTESQAAFLYEVHAGQGSQLRLQVATQPPPADERALLAIAYGAVRERLPQTLAATSLVALPILHGEEVMAALLLSGNSDPELVEFLGPAAAAVGPMLAQARVRRRLRATEQKFQRLLAAAPVGVSEMGPDGSLTFVNEALLRMTGREQLNSRDELAALVHPHDREGVEKRWAAARRDGRELVSTHRLLRVDGSVCWVQANVVEVDRADGQRSVFGIATDVSAQKELEQHLLEAKAAAEVASRAKTDFLANVSHELRTPLNGVIGVANLLAATELSTSQRELVTTILSCGNALLALISDVLDFSKIEAGGVQLERVAIDVLRLVDDCAASERASAVTKGIEFTTDLSALAGLWVEGDPVRLRQVLANLLSNAVKFTSRGGVTLAARLLGEERHAATFELAVKDTGIGIPAEKLASLFLRFNQADTSTTRRFGGTGLGLAISKQLAELMGATVNVDSVEGLGSTFTLRVTLPRVQAPIVGVAQVDAAPRSFAARVLLVEDNEINQFVARGLLGQLGIAPDVAGTGLEALSCLEQREYDLVLMDCQMPEMDGFEATRRIRSPRTPDRYRGVPIVALSASAFESDVARCREAGMNDHLSKPFTPEKLQQVLLRWLPPAL